MNSIGIIGYEFSSDFFFAFRRHTRGMNVKKIFSGNDHTPNNLLLQFPQTEVVTDMKSITEDPQIELIILSESCLHYAKHLLSAGKHVRII
jgi:hypothetical protein